MDKEERIKDIELALEGIRPHLAVDGGDVELVDFTSENIVQIRWLGACRTCSMTQMTLKAGIEDVVKAKLPFVKSVEVVEEAV